MNDLLFVVAAAMLASGPSDPAEDLPRFDLDITVETAERSPQLLSETASSTTVIGPAELRASGATHVTEVLRRVAGVDVTRTGTAGKQTSVRLDGATAAQTLVLVDGVELNSPTLGLADLTDLTLDGVERIEIVRGPMSALYGSQAMGGVIHIITRRGTGPPTASAELDGGAFASWRGAVSSSGALSDRLAYTLAASRRVSDGRDLSTGVGNLHHDGYHNASAVAGMRAAIARDTTLTVDARLIDARRDIPIELFGIRVFDANSTQNDQTALISARLRTRVGSRVEPYLSLGYSRAAQDFSDPQDPGETLGDYAADIDTRLVEIGIGAGVRVDDRDQLTVGFEYEDRHGRNRDSFGGENFDDSVGTRALFAHNRLVLGPLVGGGDSLVVTAGLRVDDQDRFGATVNPKASLLWTSGGGRWRVRAGAGRGFRAPSLNELLYPFYGNPDLDPEVARSLEAAVGRQGFGGRLDAEVRLFRTDYDDLITTDPETYTAVNLARARIEGAELEARLQTGFGLWLRGGVTLQRGKDRTTGAELLRRPTRKATLTLAYERPRVIRAALDVVTTSRMRDVEVAGFPAHNPGWTRLDLAAAWTLPGAGRVELYARIENLLDAAYSETTGFPMPGVNARGGLRMRF